MTNLEILLQNIKQQDMIDVSYAEITKLIEIIRVQKEALRKCGHEPLFLGKGNIQDTEWSRIEIARKTIAKVEEIAGKK